MGKVMLKHYCLFWLILFVVIKFDSYVPDVKLVVHLDWECESFDYDRVRSTTGGYVVAGICSSTVGVPQSLVPGPFLEVTLSCRGVGGTPILSYLEGGGSIAFSRRKTLCLIKFDCTSVKGINNQIDTVICLSVGNVSFILSDPDSDFDSD